MVAVKGHKFTLSSDGLGYVHDDDCLTCGHEEENMAAYYLWTATTKAYPGVLSGPLPKEKNQAEGKS